MVIDDVIAKICKKCMKKDYIWNPASHASENGNGIRYYC